MKSIYRNNRPILLIERVSGRMAGHCYSIHLYRITSTVPMSNENFSNLRMTGIIGSGQGFVVRQIIEDKGNYLLNTTGPIPDKIDWRTKVPPSGYDTIPCIDINEYTGETTPAINPSSKQPYPDKQFPYYIYEAEDHVDSSD